MEHYKHAYLIIAHNDFDILEKTLKLLDDVRNDFYIHIDKKVQNFSFDKFKTLTKFSNIYFIERVDARWGDFSLVKIELKLLEASVPRNYYYYHLLSGVDMPLKSNAEIHSFFDNFQGLEFVHFASDDAAIEKKEWINYYYPMRLLGANNNMYSRLLGKIAKLFLRAQRVTRFRRMENRNLTLAYGSQWFSITHNLAKYVLTQKKWITKHFRFTNCSDELFMQTLILNSTFFDSLYLNKRDGNYLGCMRFIDWTRGNPYTFQMDDFDSLINSPYLFARKFSSAKDSQIITALYEYVNCKKKAANDDVLFIDKSVPK
ncbi:MAG: glycosyl transferase [Parabacteroides sp.]|nr:glycosyl transferase [Parabacteroides sp.]